MKKTYHTPKIEILKFETESIMLMSGTGDNDAEFPPEWGDGSEEI